MGGKTDKKERTSWKVPLSLENHGHTETHGGVALHTDCAEGTVAPESEDAEWLGGDTFLSYPTLSLTVGTSALVLRTRKSNKAENYRAYIFC